MKLPNPPDPISDPAISVRGLTKVYGRGKNELRAVDDVSFDIDSGTVVGVLGPNGAGKTSILKMMLGVIAPTGGSVRIAEIDVSSNRKALYRTVGAMLEGARNVYWRLTVRENLTFFASLNGIDPRRVQKYHETLISRFRLEEKADEPVRNLSRGMKQKVSLICTLARQTDIVFLDEPTLGLDVETALELRREIRYLTEAESMTIVLSSHDMDLVEAVCDRVLIVHDGRIIADDTVENLVEIFRAQLYRVTVESGLSDQFRNQLEDDYSATNWARLEETERFEITIRSGESFYDFINDLQQAAVPLRSIRSLESNLESVFLELTDSAPQTNSRRENR